MRSGMPEKVNRIVFFCSLGLHDAIARELETLDARLVDLIMQDVAARL